MTKITRRTLARMAAAGASSGLFARAQSDAPRAPKLPTEGLTRRVAEFVTAARYADLPEQVVELGKKSMLDGLGLALVGSRDASGAIIQRYIESFRFGNPGSTVIGTAMKAPPRFAALANGIGSHADDYDDTQLAVAPDRVYGLLTHPTSPCWPAVLAVGEANGASGRDAILAYHLGVEVECKIAEAISPRHYGDGFHSTGTCGPIGAGAAIMKLYGENADACARAMSLAASQSAGLRENFGTMTKPYHAGHAAESGIAAADLVRLGWTASEKILEAPGGFFHAAGGGYDPEAIRLGRPWTFASPGVSIKPYPSGSLTHPAMSELQSIIRANEIRPDQVERLDVGTNKYMPSALIHHQPSDALQAKFSMEFWMAALLLYGRAGLNEFQDDVVKRPEVQAMIRRVNFHVHPEAEAAGYNRMTSILELHLKDGRTIAGRTEVSKGMPANPMSFDEVAAKFDDCARFAKWPAEKARGIVEGIRRLEEVRDIRSLTALLSA